MLNPESKKVLDVIRLLTGEDDIFKVIEADEILEKLPEEERMNKLQLSGIIRDLRDRDYLKVKYFTPDEYCLLTVKRTEEIQQFVDDMHAVVKGEEKPDNDVDNVRRTAKATKGAKPWRVALAAFFGAMLGGGIVTAIAIVLQKFLV